ncbi:hypothetical protein BC332_31703 [Capsicum chinense]|nr:hypothetical protein BC332_31703 [Capsicum chinense]
MTNESQMMDTTTSVEKTNISTSSRKNALPTMAPAEKPRKFLGIDFKRWQQKMFFYLTTLCLQWFTSEDAPENQDIKGTMGTLERKYKTEDAGINKFLVAQFLYFKMIDSRSVISQVQELQVIIHDLLEEAIPLKNTLAEQIKNVLNNHINYFVSLIVNDAFQVEAIVEKLPPLWKDFKNYLKNKCKEMTVEDLIVRLRIEEDNKDAERRSKGNSTINGAHIVEDDQNNSKKRKKDEQGSNQPKKKVQGKMLQLWQDWPQVQKLLFPKERQEEGSRKYD